MKDPIEDARRRLMEMIQGKAESSGRERESLDYAMEAFGEIFEELQIAQEELRQQNDMLAETHAEIEAERERYRELFEQAPDAYLVTDEKGLILEANQAAGELLNWKPQLLIGKPILVFIGQEDIRAVTRALIDPQPVRDLEICLRPKHREKIYVSVTANKVNAKASQRAAAARQEEARDAARDAGRGPVREHSQIRWILRDVNERRRTIEALDASERRFRTLFDQANQGIALLDLEGGILRVNRALVKLLESCDEDLFGQLFTDLAYAEDQAAVRESLASVSQGSLPLAMINARFPLANGEIIWTSISFSPIRGEAPPHSEKADITLVIALVENITAEKQAQNELEEMRRRLLESGEAERLRLAQELHDGPMQDLYGAVFHLSNIPEAEDHPGLAGRIELAQDIMKRVAGTLRTICGELRPPTIANLGLERAIRSHAGQIQDDHPEIEFTLQLTSDGQALPGHTRLAFFRIYQQCMTNIVRHSQASKVMISFHVNDEEVSLDVWDNGKGFTLPEKWVELLRQGHYGLAGIAERVDALRGTLKIDTKPGAGTLVHVSAPIKE